MFSLSTHLKSLMICNFSNFLCTSTNFLHNCSCHSYSNTFFHKNFLAHNFQCSLTGCSFIHIKSTTEGRVLWNGAVNSKDHYISADGIKMKPTTKHWHVVTVVNGTRSMTWPNATLSSTGSARPGQVKCWAGVVTGLSITA